MQEVTLSFDAQGSRSSRSFLSFTHGGHLVNTATSTSSSNLLPTAPPPSRAILSTHPLQSASIVKLAVCVNTSD